MTNEPLTKEKSYQKAHDMGQSMVKVFDAFDARDVLSALEGLKEEITGAMFTIPTLSDLSDDRKTACLMSLGSTLKSIDKWFPFANSQSNTLEESELVLNGRAKTSPSIKTDNGNDRVEKVVGGSEQTSTFDDPAWRCDGKCMQDFGEWCPECYPKHKRGSVRE